jgi:hypothetical protein
MFPQPQPDAHDGGFNEALTAAVPSRAERILEVGCARGRLGHELRLRDPTRYVAAEVRGRWDDRLRHIADMQASGLGRLRNVVHRVLRR